MDDLVKFLKAIADPNRLHIVGLLADQPHSGDELAAILGLKPSTVSHHLARMTEVGLVGATDEQYYRMFALNPQALDAFVARLTPEQLALRSANHADVDRDAYARQILSRWLENGRLQQIPGKLQHLRVVLQWLTDKFQTDVRYDEDQIWDTLADRWCHPHITTELLRHLVGHGYFGRLADGSWYWRSDTNGADDEAFDPLGLPIAQDPDPLAYTVRRAAMRKRDPGGDYANLKAKERVPDPQRERNRIALRLKRRRTYTADEIYGIIDTHQQDLTGEPAEILAQLLADGLVQVDEDGVYRRDKFI